MLTVLAFRRRHASILWERTTDRERRRVPCTVEEYIDFGRNVDFKKTPDHGDFLPAGEWRAIGGSAGRAIPDTVDEEFPANSVLIDPDTNAISICDAEGVVHHYSAGFFTWDAVTQTITPRPVDLDCTDGIITVGVG